MAHSAGVKLELDDFTRIGKRVRMLADLKPSGKYLMSELVAIGGLIGEWDRLANARPPKASPVANRLAGMAGRIEFTEVDTSVVD